MKVSSAIRKGIKLDGKQIRGDLFRYKGSKKDGTKEVTGCCALGAAFIGAFGTKVALSWDQGDAIQGDDVEKKLPALKKLITTNKLPTFVGGGKPLALSTAIIVLNDSQRWSREKIADWVSSIGL